MLEIGMDKVRGSKRRSMGATPAKAFEHIKRTQNLEAVREILIFHQGLRVCKL